MFIVQFWARQSRRASFRILFLAVVLAVAAISSVGVFSARLEAALVRDATQMLGGDVVIEARRNTESSPWRGLFQRSDFAPLETAESVVFPSVIPSDRTDLLVSVKAVSSSYPLVGQMLLSAGDGVELKASDGPPQGEIWVDQGVPESLGVRIGDRLSVGAAELRLTKTILIEPDRSGGFVNFAPRVMINLADLPTTGLIGFGSRATYRTYVVGPPNVISQFKNDIRSLLTPIEELETVEGGRPEVGGTLDRAKDFLAMSALIGTLVACVGIALVAHLFGKEQTAELAILKSLGFQPRQLIRLWLAGLAILTVTAGAVGVAVGWLAHWGLIALLADLVGVSLPMAGLVYLPFGILLAGLLLLGFAAVPAYLALTAPAIAVIRKQKAKSAGMQLLLAIMMGLATTLTICLIVVSNTTLALLLCVAFVGVSVVFSGLFWTSLRLLASADNRGGSAGGRIKVFQSMAKRSSTLVLQGVSLSLGLAALLILAVVQGDLVDRWQQAIPTDAPNRFVFNIQPDQVAGVRQRLIEAGTTEPTLYPMVRGRISGINDRVITLDTFTDERAKRLVEREFNISFTPEVPAYNQVTEGQWFDAETTVPQVSIENSVMDRLGLKLGDRLTFDFAGTPLTAEITSVRELRWDSMQANFYIIFPPKVLESFPQTWITAFHLPTESAAAISRELVRSYPNVTVLDTALVIRQIRTILTQVSSAVQFVFLFTVLAGGLVVVACVLTGARARTRESAIYRAMGASTSQLTKAAWLELSTLGALAGLVASIAAQGVGWAVAHFVFEFEYAMSPTYLMFGLVCGTLVSVVFGAWSVQKVVTTPVLHTLRQAS